MGEPVQTIYMSDLKELYPIFVSQSRYSGVYEGGSWYALPKADAAWAWSDSFTEYAFGDDDAAVDFWNSDESKMVGRGDTPNAAVLDLMERHFGVRQWDYDDTREPTSRSQKRSATQNGEETPQVSALLPEINIF